MIRHDCPICLKYSYSDSADNFKPCPYCGVPFSGKYGREKRTEKRLRKEIPFLLLCNGKSIQAHTKDISNQGLGVSILDSTSLLSGDIVHLKIGKSYVMLEVVWIRTKGINALSSAGLKLRDGILTYS
jgi:hypothetical protein